MSRPPDETATPNRAGPLALLCSLAYIAFALTGKELFPHLDGGAGLPETAVASEIGAAALLLLGLVGGALGLRRRTGSAAAGLCALAALLLLLPFALDAVLFPLAAAGVSPAVRGTLFTGATVAGSTLLLLAWRRARWRARTAEPKREPGHEQRHAAPPHESAASAGSAESSRSSSTPRSRVPRALVHGGVALASLAGALLAGEAVFRALDIRPYSNPMLIIPGDERRILLSEVALFRPYGTPGERAGPSARFRPYFYLKGWYDRPQWDYFDEQGCVDYVFNRWGLRDHDFELEKQPDEFRVVAIGDSFTFGIGAQLDDCWTEVLERALHRDLQRPVEVINAGFASGHNPTMYPDWIAKDGVKLQPDVLIVGLCLNDMHPDVEMYTYELRETAPLLGGRLLLVNWVQRQTLQFADPARAVLRFTEHVRREPAQWEQCQAALRSAKAALDAAHIRLVVVPFPMLSGLREPHYPYAELMAMVRDFCAEAQIECVDLLPDFLGQQDETLWAHPTDQHPNDLGHRLIGEGIAAYLARR